MDIQNIAFDRLIQKYHALLVSAADSIWDYAETAYTEYKSASLLKHILTDQGFKISDCPQLPTAFSARFGSGKPVIGLLGEYDALPGMSQKADCTSPEPLRNAQTSDTSEAVPGHGCGHNLLGTGMLAATLLLKDIMTKEKLSGTIIFFGCPAEENESGKSRMIEQNFFKDVDAAFSWHPHYQTGILNQTLANQRVLYKFHGISAHASQAPHLGRSALDACELMNIGVNYLREHMIDDARIHYAYLNSGGKMPNIIPAETEVLYAIRAPKSHEAALLRKRVDNIAKGAAMMTETSVEIETKCVYDDIKPNKTLDQLVLKYMNQFTPVSYTAEELAYADKFLPFGTCPANSLSIDSRPDLSPARKTGISTDVGNVSQILPCSAFMTTCYAWGSPLHHWTVTAQGKSSIAHKGMFTAAKIAASCILELLTDRNLIDAAKKDFQK